MNREIFENIWTPENINDASRMGLSIPPFEDFTCSDCPKAENCPYAFDLYCTDRDCLLDK